MRVTNRMISNNVTSHIQSNLSRLARTQEEVSTSKSMLRPSDKPQSMSQLLSVKASLSYLEQYRSNVKDGLSYLNLSDGSMQTMNNIMAQAEELAVQGASDTYDPNDRIAIAEQIDKMIDQMVDLANSSIGGRYIYAGTLNTSAPFTRVGDQIVYSGDYQGIYREVLSGDDYRIDAPGVTRGYSIAAIKSDSGLIPDVATRPDNLAETGIFTITFDALTNDFNISNQTELDGVTPASLVGTAPGDYTWDSAAGTLTVNNGDLQGLVIQFDPLNPPSDDDQFTITVDSKLGVFGHADASGVVYSPPDPLNPKDPIDEGIFDVLFKLRDNLRNNDRDAVDSTIAEVQEKTDQLLARRVGIGARMRHFEALEDQMNDIETKLTDFQDQMEGADMYKLSIDMSQQQVTFEASLSSGANILRVSLLDFLK